MRVRSTIPTDPSARRRERRGIALLCSLAAVLAMVALAGSPAAGRSAQGDPLEVRAGWSGRFRPGSTLPVWVNLPSGRDGVVELTVRTASEQVSRVRVAPPDDPATPLVVRAPLDTGVINVEIRLLIDDAPKATGTTTLEPLRDDEVVGLLPGFKGSPPEDPVPLLAAAGTADVRSLVESDLVVGALAPLGTIVAGPDGLGGLGEGGQRAVLAWLAAGGTLLVDGPLPVPGVPDRWQPPDVAGRLPAGLGEVRATDGRLADGSWLGTLEPTPTATTLDTAVTSVGYAGGGVVADSLAGDAGFRLPPVNVVAGFLLIYVLVIGPLLFRLLRGGDRRLLVWVAVPAIAALVTAAVWWSGENVRAHRRVAFGLSVLETGGGDIEMVHVATIASGAERFTTTFPAGWNVTSASGDPGGGEGALATVGRRPAGEGSHVQASVELGPGDRGIMVAGGPTPATNAMDVTARTVGNTIVGEVRNNGKERLDRVAVFVGIRSEIVGRLDPGASAQWTIEGVNVPDVDALFTPSELRVWADILDIDELGRPVGPVNPSVWSALLDAVGPNLRTPGAVVAAGWTMEAKRPFVTDGDISGRTVVVGRAPVSAEGALTGWDVRRDLLRPPGSASLVDLQGATVTGTSGLGLVRFVLPAGREVDETTLVLSVPIAVGKVEIRVRGEWVSFDPSATQDPTTIHDPTAPPTLVPLPAGAVEDGAVFVRFATRPEAAPAGGAELLLRERS